MNYITIPMWLFTSIFKINNTKNDTKLLVDDQRKPLLIAASESGSRSVQLENTNQHNTQRIPS